MLDFLPLVYNVTERLLHWWDVSFTDKTKTVKEIEWEIACWYQWAYEHPTKEDADVASENMRRLNALMPDDRLIRGRYAQEWLDDGYDPNDVIEGRI